MPLRGGLYRTGGTHADNRDYQATTYAEENVSQDSSTGKKPVPAKETGTSQMLERRSVPF